MAESAKENNDEKKVISVIGYNSCGYYHSACNVANQYGKKNNIRVVCKAWDRGQYKQWLSQQQNSGNVDRFHTKKKAMKSDIKTKSFLDTPTLLVKQRNNVTTQYLQAYYSFLSLTQLR